MIDTGSDVSALPPAPAQRQRPNPSCTLRAVNYSSIKTYGCSSLVLTLGLRKQFPFVFGDSIFRDVDFVVVYIDDVLVAS